jgi:hypothetical protein
MCEALRTAARFRHPQRRVLLVSDGQPTDGDPIQVARSLGCPIDTVYVGPVSGEGKETLRNIAEITGGEFLDMAGKFDASRFLAHTKKVMRLEG